MLERTGGLSDANAQRLAIGATLGGIYEIERLLGIGGMGEVYEARDRAIDRRVAIKVPRAGVASNLLRREGTAMAKVRHPSVVAVHCAGRDGDVDYLVMELLRGESLQTHIEQREGAHAPFAFAEIVDVLLAIADGLAAIHRAALAHRDVKPENVMLTADGRVVLTDFGLGILERDVGSSPMLVGSPPYMAPEVISATVRAGEGHLVDLYALGVLAYEMLTGAVPFAGRTSVETLQMHLVKEATDVEASRAGVPPPLASIVRALMAREARARPRSADALIVELRSIRRELVGAAPTTNVRLATEIVTSGPTSKIELARASRPSRGSSGEHAGLRLASTSRAALARMIDPRALRVVFQPIVELADGALFAHEALVRCDAPELSDPAELFRVANARRCAGRLGRMVRELAFPLAPGIPLFVNIHPSELDEPWLARIDDPIFSHDRDVYVEITESSPLSAHGRYAGVLAAMRSRAGIHIVIDDLGSGYSNLKWLARLEPDVVKIDRELIRGIDCDARQRTLVTGVARLSAELGARVVAEGIESASELAALRDCGITYGQGYLFARPAFPIPSIAFAEQRQLALCGLSARGRL